MNKTLEKIRNLNFVLAVDDERNIGNSIIVTLKNGFEFKNEKGCGVRGFDTVLEAKTDCKKSNIKKNF